MRSSPFEYQRRETSEIFSSLHVILLLMTYWHLLQPHSGLLDCSCGKKISYC